jgi:hypothetical protein
LKKEETGEWRFPGPNNTRPLKTGYFDFLTTTLEFSTGRLETGSR